MYAIVEIAGQQFKVTKDQQIFVHRLKANEGEKVNFDNVYLTDDNGKITVGAPAINGAQVSASVLRHFKGDTVIVFKKKRRKGYQKSNGHRQFFTEIKIDSIVASGAKPSVKAETPKKEEAPKKEAVAPKKEAAAPVKEVAPKKEVKTSTDDLTKITGVGPKLAEILVEAGYTTYTSIQKAKIEDLKAVLENAGGRYKSIDPSTWADEAKAASK